MHKRAHLLVILFPLFAACDSAINCTEGNGIVTTTSRTIEPFESVNVKGSFDVILKRGSDRNILIEADSNLLAHITTTVKSDELIIDTEGCINTDKKIRITVTSPTFRSLELNGSGSISSDELISTDDEELLELAIDGSGTIDLEVFTKMVKSDIDGSGSITLRGKTEGQVVTVEGSGAYNAFQLKANETVVDLAGSGNINVNSTGALTVENSGSGMVRYKGNPSKLSSDVTGSGKVVQQQ